MRSIVPAWSGRRVRSSDHVKWISVLVLSLALACSSSGPSADSLAGRACGHQVDAGGPHGVNGSGVVSSISDLAEFDRARDDADISANLAARAARKDASWKALADAFSSEVYGIDLMRPAAACTCLRTNR